MHYNPFMLSRVGQTVMIKHLCGDVITGKAVYVNEHGWLILQADGVMSQPWGKGWMVWANTHWEDLTC